MSYPIILKRCISPVNKLDKDFDGDTTSFDVVLKENTDVFQPTFILQTSGDKLWKYNYIDGSNFSGRQYFITDVRCIGNNRFEIDAKTDVLSTWSNQKRSNYAVIRRQEKVFNLYSDDPEFKTYNYERIQTLKFKNASNPFSKTLRYILTVNGNYNVTPNNEERGDDDNGNESRDTVS